MTDTKDLVARLRMRGVFDPAHVDNAAADALEAQDKRIAGLEALAQGRLEQMEADRKQYLDLKAELAQVRDQKPVGWQWAGTAHFRRNIPKDAEKYAWTPLFAAPGAKPETAKVYDPLPRGKV